MTRKLMWALIIIAVVVLVLIFNKGDVDVNLIVTRISALKALVFLSFVVVGVAIGILLK